MKREELKKWAESLQPGDKVVKARFFGNDPVDVLTVERLTKTGRVVTNRGTYHMTGEYASCYKGYGDSDGLIIPATPENIQAAQIYKKLQEERVRINITIQKAKAIAYDLRYGRIPMDYAFAVDLIELVKKHTGRNEGEL